MKDVFALAEGAHVAFSVASPKIKELLVARMPRLERDRETDLALRSGCLTERHAQHPSFNASLKERKCAGCSYVAQNHGFVCSVQRSSIAARPARFMRGRNTREFASCRLGQVPTRKRNDSFPALECMCVKQCACIQLIVILQIKPAALEGLHTLIFEQHQSKK